MVVIPAYPADLLEFYLFTVPSKEQHLLYINIQIITIERYSHDHRFIFVILVLAGHYLKSAVAFVTLDLKAYNGPWYYCKVTHWHLERSLGIPGSRSKGYKRHTGGERDCCPQKGHRLMADVDEIISRSALTNRDVLFVVGVMLRFTGLWFQEVF